MPDISMCEGTGCPLKSKCYRHVAKPNEQRQSWLLSSPFIMSPDGDFKCEFLWNLKPEESSTNNG